MTEEDIIGLLNEFGWHKGMLMGEELEDEWFKGMAEIRLCGDYFMYYAHPEWKYGDSYMYDEVFFTGDRLATTEEDYVML